MIDRVRINLRPRTTVFLATLNSLASTLEDTSLIMAVGNAALIVNEIKRVIVCTAVSNPIWSKDRILAKKAMYTNPIRFVIKTCAVKTDTFLEIMSDSE